jgi:hypothetical protein
VVGGKSTTASRPELVIEEFDSCHLRPVMRDTCTRLRHYTLTGVELEHLSLDKRCAALGMVVSYPNSFTVANTMCYKSITESD